MDNLLDDIRLASEAEVNCAQASSGRQHFFLGPVRLDWLQKASQLPGKAIHVGLAILFEGRVTAAKEIKIRPSMMRRFGVQRHSMYRALKHLARESLIIVHDQRRGSSPTVILLNHIPDGMNWR